jgi:predicted alpha/beta-fold hydrolase
VKLNEAGPRLAKRKFLIFFSPGWFGSTFIGKANGFTSIIRGTEKWLRDKGYEVELSRYDNRTQGTHARIFQSMIIKELAQHITSFTARDRKRKVLLMGDSLGAVFVNRVRKRLGKNESVYAILSGSPFWYARYVIADRTLILDNGTDFLHSGDILGMMDSIIAHRFPAVGIHGPHYTWEDRNIRAAILAFLYDEVIQ